MGAAYTFFETIRRMLFDFGWPTTVLTIILIVMTLAIVASVIYGLFYLLDTCFLPTYEQKGVIDGHSYSPPSMILIGTGGILNPYHIPEGWSVRVRVGKRAGWMSVTKLSYDFVRDGQPVVARFTNRRFTRKIHIKSAS